LHFPPSLQDCSTQFHGAQSLGKSLPALQVADLMWPLSALKIKCS
jgi:hypothetical protein